MKTVLLFLILSVSLHAASQDETVRKLQADASRDIKKEEDTTGRLWRKGGIYSINLAQSALNNWAAGGDQFSLSVNSILSLYAFYKKDRSSWDNTLDFNLGYLRSTSLGSRKNDDRIDLLSKYGHAISSKWNVAGLVNFRSQLLKGYSYDDGGRDFTSSFLSPAYLLTSIGLDYKPNASFSVFVSPVTARWIFVKNDSLAARGLYGVDSGRHSRKEFGAFVSANYVTQFNDAVSYKGRLDLFSNYRNNPGKIDVFMSNILSVKLSKVFSATWNVDLIYDDDIRIFGEDGRSPAVQLKSLVGLGLMVQF